MADRDLSMSRSSTDRVRHQKSDSRTKANKDDKPNATEKKSSGSRQHRTEKINLARHKVDLDRLKFKMNHTMQLLKEQQKEQEDGVKEYLRLSTDANKAQQQRIKSLFEKRNQKSAQTIADLQSKLEVYMKRIQELEAVDVDNIQQETRQKKTTGNGFKKIVSKPIEHIKNKLGSSDNIANKNTLKVPSGEIPSATSSVQVQHSQQSDRDTGLPSNASENMLAMAIEKEPSKTRARRLSDGFQNLFSPHSRLIVSTLNDIQQEQQRLSNAVAALRTKMLEDYRAMEELVEVEREICDRLDEQINDLSELYRNEIANLKQDLYGIEEKLLYQVDQKTQDLQTQLDSCDFRVGKLELQQSQQQIMQRESHSHSSFHIIAVFNLVIYLISLLLILLQTMFGLLSPFMTTRLRYFTTFFVVLCLTFVWYNWNFFSPLFQHWINVYYYGMPVPARSTDSHWM